MYIFRLEWILIVHTGFCDTRYKLTCYVIRPTEFAFMHCDIIQLFNITF